MTPQFFVVLCLLITSQTVFSSGYDCTNQPFQGDNTKFLDVDSRIRVCSPVGFVYEQRHCGCTSLIDTRKYSDKRPELMITFKNGSVKDVNNLVYVRNVDVAVTDAVPGSVDGYVGVFSGGHLQVPYFRGLEFGARLRIEIRYLETEGTHSDRVRTLVSNNDRIGGSPTIFIGLSSSDDNVHERTRMYCNSGVEGGLELENPQGWKTVIFDYNAIEQSRDDPAAELTIISEHGERSTNSRQMTGNILPTDFPLFIGDGPVGQAPFIGYIDHIIVTRAKPDYH